MHNLKKLNITCQTSSVIEVKKLLKQFVIESDLYIKENEYEGNPYEAQSVPEPNRVIAWALVTNYIEKDEIQKEMISFFAEGGVAISEIYVESVSHHGVDRVAHEHISGMTKDMILRD